MGLGVRGGLPPSRTVASFQLKAAAHCSKSRISNHRVGNGGGGPPSARGSGTNVQQRPGVQGGIMQRRQNLCAWVIMCALMLFSVPRAAAQASTADLSGTVSDPAGGTVRDARVTVTLLSTGVTRTTTTDDAGRYSFVQLTPGHYKLVIQHEGFSVLNREVDLTVGA